MSPELWHPQAGVEKRRGRTDRIPPAAITSRFPGDPGVGNFYVGWDDGPKAEGKLSVGKTRTTSPLSVYHTYSGAADARVSSADADTAIANHMLSSQSFKMSTWTPAQIVSGNANAAIDDSIAICKARAPHPIWLCYYHEPSDNFTTSSSAADYRAAFRYMVLRFRAAGVTNVAWQTILKSPWDFLTTAANTPGDGDLLSDGAPSGGSNNDWRWWHPDWKGTNNRNATDWYTGANAVIDMIGLDQYVPITPSGTYPYTYAQMMNYCRNDIEVSGCDIKPYTHPEFGMGYQASPRPNWLTYCQNAVPYIQTHNVVSVQYWNHSATLAHEKDFDATGDPDGTKLLGWNYIASQATVFSEGGA